VTALLETHGVTVRFGGNVALNEVTIDAHPGLVTGLIGPNGAGKTTLFNVITGLLPPTTGSVSLHGDDIGHLPPHKRARRGMARTFQRLELFTSLTVRENIQVAGEIRNGWGNGWGNGWDRRHRMNPASEADRIIELVGLGPVADRDVSDIPTGTARVVELGRALMTRPQVLLLDEPASGQTEQETEDFGRLLQQLAHTDGLTVLLVEHDMSLVMAVCDFIHVLDFGRIIARGTPAEIRSNQAVLDAYLGAEGEGAEEEGAEGELV
jgi:branched-chain amino acid transport system ATP-binding protein